MITEHDYKLIDEYSRDGTGWARFSADKLQRYRIGRIVNPRAFVTSPFAYLENAEWMAAWVRVVFLCLNPSTADERKPDNTLTRCVKFAQVWGGDVAEIVNLFAFRSTFPKDLKTAVYRGDGPENDEQILAACRGAIRVVAAYGAGGDLYGRAAHVRELLRAAEIPLYHLGLSQEGLPKHPLARGKHYIPYEQKLEAF